jgi:hypothetical protein
MEAGLAERMTSPGGRWRVLLAAAGGALLLLMLDPFGGAPRWEYDTMTYLKLAEGIGCFPGCALGFDYVPAAMQDAHFQTTFPVGFPLVLHGLRRLGVSMVMAPFLASGLAYVGAVTAAADLFVAYLAAPLALGAALLLAVSSPVLQMGRDSGSEMTAVFLFLIGLALMARARRATGRRRLALLAAAAQAIAATVWIRYAMLPAVAACALALVLTWPRDEGGPRELGAALALMAVSVAGLVALNLGLGHSVTGPFRPPSERSLVANVYRFANHLVGTTFGVLGAKERWTAVTLAALLVVVLGLWTWDSIARARRAGWLGNAEFVTALVFLPLYAGFLVVTAARVQYDPLANRFMSVFASALVIVVMTPTLQALERREGAAPARAVLATLLGLFLIGQHIDGVTTPWPVWRRFPRPFEVVSPDLTAAVRASLSSVPHDASVLASNHKGFLLAERWPGGEIFLGNDRHFRPSLLTEAALDELTCRRGGPVVLVLDRSRPWPAWETGDYLQALLEDRPVPRVHPLLERPGALVLLASFEPERCHAIAGR